MPNCDFYATLKDHEEILNILFEESGCEIYETASDYEKPLKQFFNTSEILSEFNRTYPNGNKWSSVELHIYVLDCGFKFTTDKIKLNPEACDGFEYRYSAKGLGLIQLYLEIPSNKGLRNSHTNHNTKKRALNWARTPEEIVDIELCDYKKITQFSSKLNRLIRKNALGKISSRPVLPGALEVWNKGVSLNPYSPNDTKIK